MELSLFAELKRRRVFRAILAWGIIAFAVLQIIEPVMHGLHWSDAVLSYVVVALALGFPVVVALAWVFDVREGRIERTPAGTLRGLPLAALVIGLGVAAAAPGAIYFFVSRRSPPAESAPASIAVLPFVNMSSDKETDYFSDGITEELINALANVEGLRVASRTAVFALKSKALGVQQIGAELNVGALLEGSIRREGNALRITAQLIKVSDGYHLWSKTYDRELKSVFAVEDEIARSIAASLQRALVGVKAGTSDVEAHDLYLKGRFFWNKRSGEALRKSVALFEAAIGKDPNYALAQDGLADALAILVEYGEAPAEQMLPKAWDAARRAVEIDPAMGEAHASLGLIAYEERNWSEARAELRKAIELSPKYAMAYKWSGNLLDTLGRLPEAREALEHALRLDPTSLIINTDLAENRMYAREFQGAAEQYQRTLEMDPEFGPARAGLAHVYALQGKHAEALAELARIPATSLATRVLRAQVLAMAGRREEALALAGRLGESDGFSNADRASVWAALGETDKALALLTQACVQGKLWPGLRIDPDYDSVRNHPRFAEILRCAEK